jgi:hypothetical protein
MPSTSHVSYNFLNDFQLSKKITTQGIVSGDELFFGRSLKSNQYLISVLTPMFFQFFGCLVFEKIGYKVMASFHENTYYL